MPTVMLAHDSNGWTTIEVWSRTDLVHQIKQHAKAHSVDPSKVDWEWAPEARHEFCSLCGLACPWRMFKFDEINVMGTVCNSCRCGQ